MSEMLVHQSNLLFALRAAIVDQRRVEKDHGFTGDSALVARWEAMYKHVQLGGQIHIMASKS